MSDRKIFGSNRIIPEVAPVGGIPQVERPSGVFGPPAFQLSGPDGASRRAPGQLEEDCETDEVTHDDIS